MVWETKPDCHLPFISNSVRRDTIDGLMTVLHFRDNTNIDGDPFFKIRPLINTLNEAGVKYFVSENYLVDEIMIKYFGKYGAKQYIHGKPVKFGYKGR